MTSDDTRRLPFVKAGPAKPQLTAADREQVTKEVSTWRKSYATVKAEMREVTKDDLRIRAR